MAERSGEELNQAGTRKLLCNPVVLLPSYLPPPTRRHMPASPLTFSRSATKAGIRISHNETRSMSERKRENDSR